MGKPPELPGGMLPTLPGIVLDSASLNIAVSASVVHMTPEAATAAREVARYTHAVPAEEKTKRAKQKTYRHLITGGVAGGLALAACLTLSGGALTAVLIALAGFVAADNTLPNVIGKGDD